MTSSVQQQSETRADKTPNATPFLRLRTVGVIGAVALVVLTLWLWRCLVNEENDRIRTHSEREAQWLAHHIEMVYAQGAGALDRMARRWEFLGGTPQPEWLLDAENYISSLPGFTAIGAVDAQGKPRAWVPDAFRDALREPAVAAVYARGLEQARTARHSVVSEPVTLPSQEQVFFQVRPLFVDGRDDGALVGLFNFTRILPHVLTPALSTGHAIRLIHAGAEAGTAAPNATSVALNFGNGRWTLLIAPHAEAVARYRSALPWVVRGGGMATATFVLALFWLWSAAAHRAADAMRARELLRVQALAMDAVPVGVTIADATAASQPLIYVNPAFERITGYSRAEAVGRNCRFLQGTDQNQQGVRELRDALPAGRAEHVLLRNYHKDGTAFWNELSVTPIRDSAGHVTHFVGIQNDVTARINKDRELRESAQLLQEAQRIAHVGHWSLDVPSGKLFWSDEIYRIFGCEPGSVVPSYEWFFDFVHPDDVARVKESEQRAFAGQGRHSIDHRIVWADGSVHWVHEEAEVTFGADGQPERLAGTVQDITVRKQIEEAWRSGQVRLRAVLDTAVDGVITIDARGTVESFNPAAEKIFGYAAHEVIGHNISMLMPDPLRAAHDGYMERYMSSGEARIIGIGREVNGLHKDGTVFPLDLAVSEMEVGGQRMFTGLVRDITVRKSYETELIAAKDVAEKASRAKSEFLSSMSHELRTPLNSIIGFAQLLESDHTPLSEEQRNQVGLIAKSGYLLLGLINDLLDLSRIESGSVPMSIEPVPLDEVIAATVQLVQPLLKRNQLTLTVTDGAGKGMAAYADYVRLKQILTNYLSNAIKYNRPGGSITVDCVARDDGYMRIAVHDTGLGVAREKQAELFTSFQRLGHENSTIEGTGIGLVITKRLAEMMRGRTGFASEPGVGSTFWVEFPAAKILVSPSPVAAATVPPPATAPEPGVHTVLYVEDNPANLRFMERLIARRPNTRLLTAHEPQLGLELARVHRPDLVLLDINLPGMDGYEVLQRLRGDAATAEIAVFAVTANAMPHEVERGQAAGFNGYVTKPINVPQFLQVLDGALESKSQLVGSG